MASSTQAAQKALIAFHRFGLGAKQRGFGAVKSDPLEALQKELKPAVALIDDDTLPNYAKAAREASFGFERAEALRAAEFDARIAKHMRADIGFVERLVIFWSNHFSMSVNKSDAVRGMIGQLEREVIRKHVLGKFTDMLLGVMKHPAMLSFLDNADSIGPRSQTGELWGVGYNENLARESMELHTVGSGGGYTEDDVIAYAKILTGWSYVRGWEADNHYNGGTKQNRGRFIFRKYWHEPGKITFRGKTYEPEGMTQGVKAMRDLARSPATAEHIAFKLVRHFITDEPTPAMVNPLKKRYLETGGDLRAVSMALLKLPEAWALPLSKVRTPYELAIAQLRALGLRYKKDQTWAFTEPLRALNQAPWECPSPEGFSDDTLYWLDPDGMTIRLDTAQLSGWLYRDRLNASPKAIAKAVFNDAISRQTLERIGAAGETGAGLTILFSSPEFQRR